MRRPARNAGGASREDRLTRHEPAGTLQLDDIKVELAYDYMGRRIEKKVYDWNDQAGDWEATPSLHRKFIWGGTGGSSASGWLLLLELEGGTGDPPVETVVRKSTWGLDLAGMSGQSRDRKGAGMLGQSRDRKGADAAYGAAALQGAGGTLDKTLSRQGQVGGLLAVLNAAEEPGHNEIGIMSRFLRVK